MKIPPQEHQRAMQTMKDQQPAAPTCKPNCPICDGTGEVALLHGMVPLGKRPCPRIRKD